MNLIISSSPHIKRKMGLKCVMWNFILALMPVVAVSVYYFTWNALRTILLSLFTCIAAEYIFIKIRKKELTLSDGSAIATALLFALILPPTLPAWMIILGAGFAMIFGKQVFGGLGYNIFNPALIGRAFLMASYPIHMTTWVYPKYTDSIVDVVTCATPLGLAKFSHIATNLNSLFFGNVAGSLGETSALAILIGGLYLLIMGIADWRVPASLLASFSFLSAILWISGPEKYFSPLFHIFSGGLLFGALFMATDPVTSPVTKKGRLVFGIGIGLFVFIIRNWGGLPEGVMYSILIMNALSPLIDRLTKPKRFGL